MNVFRYAMLLRVGQGKCVEIVERVTEGIGVYAAVHPVETLFRRVSASRLGLPRHRSISLRVNSPS